MSAAAVVVEDLHVAYGTTWALDGVDLDVASAARGVSRPDPASVRIPPASS